MADRVPCCRRCGGVLDPPDTSQMVECRNCGKSTYVRGSRGS